MVKKQDSKRRIIVDVTKIFVTEGSGQEEKRRKWSENEGGEVGTEVERIKR